MVNIEFNTETGGMSVEGGPAVDCKVETRMDGSSIVVRYALSPVGDGALYAGTMEAVVTVTKPLYVEGVDMDEQSTTAAEHVSHYAEALSTLLPQTLLPAIQECAGRAVAGDGPDPDVLAALSGMVTMIATITLMRCDGDTAKAKVLAEEYWALTAQESKGNLTDEQVASALEAVHFAIDHLASNA